MSRSADGTLLLGIYRKLRKKFGHLRWWPGRSRYEIIVGAILTQNTSWRNVEKAIASLRKARLLTPEAMHKVPLNELAALIRSAGYFNVKAARLKSFLRFLYDEYDGNLTRMFASPVETLRTKLLGVPGIGPETADSILLYAGNKPVFVVDAYTKRIFSRHGFISESAKYEAVQAFFSERLPASVELFNDYHAQIVKVGNTLCKRSNPNCSNCPLEYLLPDKSKRKLL